jgi:hypothetical protein
MADKVRIVKVGDTAPMPAPRKKSKSMKTFPRGVLKGGKTARAKIQAVRDPAKSPPVRKSTLRILTEKGAENRRHRIKKTVRAMPDAKVRQVLKASGMAISEKTPSHIAKEILEGGMEAGLIVAK